MAVLLPYRDDYYLWNYLPSVAAAVIFLLFFLALAFLHTWKIRQTGCKFCICFTIGCFFEFIGYCGRASAHRKTDKLMPYIIQSIFILVAPALFAASIYMTLGRIVRSVRGEHHSVIRINWLTKLFVIGDVLSFMIQSGSSGLMFNSSTVKMGEMMVTTGLFVQIISFGLFFVTAGIFHMRMRKQPTPESYVTDALWKESLIMLYVVSILIFARSLFRVVEYIQGQQGYALQHEWTLYLFDSVPMAAVAAVFFWRFPSTLVPPPVSHEGLILNGRK
ncbi:RTA1 like protein-domain-containing protein [Leptodontidium sp. 2 PMI_412]|nr:RTA1 like protein-domain-containing protein [Leptodontidium sp. 2 PMI_412]